MALVAAQPPVRGTAILFLNIVGSTVPPPPPVTADVVSGSTVKDVTVAVEQNMPFTVLNVRDAHGFDLPPNSRLNRWIPNGAAVYVTVVETGDDASRAAAGYAARTRVHLYADALSEVGGGILVVPHTSSRPVTPPIAGGAGATAGGTPGASGAAAGAPGAASGAPGAAAGAGTAATDGTAADGVLACPRPADHKVLRLPDRPDLLVRPWNTEPSKERLSATEALHVATTSFNLMMKEAKATRQDESWVDTLAPPALRRAAGLQSTWTGVRLPLFAARWLEATSKIDEGKMLYKVAKQARLQL